MSELQLLRLIAIVASLGLLLRASAGRMAPRMALAPLLFLMTRLPVLIAWVIGAAGMYTLIASGAAANGKDPDPVLIAGICILCGLGFAALVVGPLFMIARAFARKPELPLEDRETIVDSFAANHLLGREARGGKMIVTERRLGFVPHRFNVQLDVWSRPLEQVRGARAEGLRLLVLDTDLGEEVFVVMSPKALAERLMSRAAGGLATGGAR